MTQKILSLCLLTATALSMNAKPAKRNTVTLTQPSGATIEATFYGDEFGSFYVDHLGQHLRCDSLGYWKPMSALQVESAKLQQQSLRRQHAIDVYQQQGEHGLSAVTRAAASATSGNTLTLGEHRMLTLLIQFSDLEFTEGTKEHYEEMLNGTDYTYQGATGSAQRYFRDQSQERFTPTFDVVGPVTLSKGYAYYGANKNGSDAKAREAITTGIKSAIAQGLITDLSPYDNDGDGYVDLIYVFYAGYSEADCGIADYIWPHQWALATPVTLNGIRLYKYACSSELQGSPTDKTATLDGIGSCVHEFSHGLGLPDFYNTGDSTSCYGMDRWSTMDQGCYNNGSLTPPNYTAYERYSLGWLDFEELPTQGDVVLPRVSTDNKAYIYRNPSNEDEAFIFENHQSEGWDAYYDYGKASLHGMFITHLDYDKTAWTQDVVNNIPSHQRYTMVPADGTLYSYDMMPDYTTASQTKFIYEFRGDIWPGYTKNTAFGRRTTPAAVFYTGDSATFDISGIAEDAEGNITFHVHPYETPEHATSSECPSAAIDLLTSDFAGRYVDLYDLAGRLVLSGVERAQLSALPIRPGYYILHDGKSTRKIFINY